MSAELCHDCGGAEWLRVAVGTVLPVLRCAGCGREIPATALDYALPGGGFVRRRHDEGETAFSGRLARARAAALDAQRARTDAESESPLTKAARVWEKP